MTKGSASDDFRRSLKLDGHYWEYETKDELRVLMTQAGYRSKKEKGVVYMQEATDKQVDFAWGYLRRVSIQETFDTYTVHTYHKQIIKRANQNQTIKGKQYRKGQFIPKG